MDSINGVVEHLRDYFAGRPADLVCVYLFGSFARGEPNRGSDVDLGLLCERSPEPGISGIHSTVENDLEHALGRRVQAVILNSAPPDLIHRVLRDGVLVLEADRSRRIRFEVAARREYLDLLPVLREYRQARTS